jgi:hypothetical protein
MLVHQVDDRHDVHAAELNLPAGHGGAAQRNTQPVELWLLAVEGQAIDELGRRDLRQQRGVAMLLGNSCSGTGAIFTPA